MKKQNVGSPIPDTKKHFHWLVVSCIKFRDLTFGYSLAKHIKEVLREFRKKLADGGVQIKPQAVVVALSTVKAELDFIGASENKKATLEKAAQWLARMQFEALLLKMLKKDGKAPKPFPRKKFEETLKDYFLKNSKEKRRRTKKAYKLLLRLYERYFVLEESGKLTIRVPERRIEV